MGTTLFWKPSVKDGLALSYDFKAALRRRCDVGRRGLTFSENDIEWLRGVIAATGSEQCRTDAEALIDAIAHHGRIDLWEES